jgi:hypothetical protein
MVLLYLSLAKPVVDHGGEKPFIGNEEEQRNVTNDRIESGVVANANNQQR